MYYWKKNFSKNAKNHFGPKNFFRPKMPKKANFSIKNGFLVVKKGFGAQNGRKWSKNGQKTILDQNFFRPFLDHFGPFWHQKSFFSPKKPIFVQNKYFEQKKILDEKFWFFAILAMYRIFWTDFNERMCRWIKIHIQHGIKFNIVPRWISNFIFPRSQRPRSEK